MITQADLDSGQRVTRDEKFGTHQLTPVTGPLQSRQPTGAFEGPFERIWIAGSGGLRLWQCCLP